MLRDNTWKLVILTGFAVSGLFEPLASAAPPHGSGTIRQVAGGTSSRPHHNHHAPSTAQRSSSGSSLADRLRAIGNRILGDTTPEAAVAPQRQAPEDWSHLAHPVPGSRNGSSNASRSRTAPGAARRPVQDEDILLPEPPVEDAPKAQTAAEPTEPTDTGDASDSSRRSGRRSIEPMSEVEAADAAERPSTRSSSTPTREVAPVPKVPRRPLPTRQSNATPAFDTQDASSRRRMPTGVDAPEGAPAGTADEARPARATADDDIPAAPSAESDDESAWQQTPRETTPTGPSVSRRPLAARNIAARPAVPDYTASAAPQQSTTAAPAASSVPSLEETRPAAQPQRTLPLNSTSSSALHLAATEVPALRVTTNGPRQVTIGIPAKYEVIVENRGSLEVSGLVVRTTLPAWISLNGHRASRGEAVVQENRGERIMMWQVSNIAAGETERLALELAPQEAKAFDMQIEWTLMPLANVASITVQEPKLELRIDGPDQVTYGDSKVYSVRVLNPGTGVAKDVVFTLSPNSATPQRQSLGDIPPGQEAQFEVELSAHDGGSLEIHGLVTATANLRDEQIKKVKVASAELVATLDGPPLQYKDGEAVYYLSLTNEGSAGCADITATLQLPAGMEYLEGIAGATAENGSLRWNIPRLDIGQTEEYEIACRLTRTGSHQLAFECQGTAAGKTTATLATEVEAIADLVLAIKDPPAPAPVGEDVVYEVVIHNRGSKAAEKITAVAQFSTGIEPSSASGHGHEVVPGQVLFEEIPRIEAGAEVRLQMVARAEAAGVHRFRSEVRSGETVLVAEEATRYITLTASRSNRSETR